MRFWQCLGVMLVFGALDACKYTAGEEIGWRGYMLTRLVDSGIKAPILISGLIWGLWHAPLILSGQYASGPADSMLRDRIRYCQPVSSWPASWRADMSSHGCGFRQAASGPASGDTVCGTR